PSKPGARRGNRRSQPRGVYRCTQPFWGIPISGDPRRPFGSSRGRFPLKESWVVNASPLITLAKIRRLSLLRTLEREVLIPSAVATELLAGPADDPAAAALQAGEI